jgi:glycosyltransferase involved in cell wall biosynthesis
MASVDAVVMPSRREPYGLVALEALAAGRALLVSDVDGLRDHARNGAITVKGLTAAAWADALEELPNLTSEASRRQARDIAIGAKDSFVKGWQSLLNGVTL